MIRSEAPSATTRLKAGNGATYTLTQGFWSKPQASILPIFNREQHFCGLGVIKKVGDQENIEPIQQLQIKTGFACLKFVI
ncbi:hypothetical protein [Pseudomonas cichorii]|uniref:Uncharacterized protein n=1 Tax=Pseudomonas cichorii TaxID=36746 RepID=A0ABQ1DHE4_PSECI|nr:hypothetical protein [Pseudomonas cichorii]QVE19171.1 hypothetical protein KGD89_10750 [Pseudomonas cichorii]GFM90403.1 hypothetical protein PSCICP_03750 [Pseudomonas cichorii]SDN53263.1 hypothetical protein SAMN05216599_102276 [Pseudomonas cichorii]